MKDMPKTSPIVDALCYPLLFPHGELGWSTNISVDSTWKRKRMSMAEFDLYRIMICKGVFNPIVNAGKLTQQFIVDRYVTIKGDCLHYLKLNQNRLRAYTYAGLQDYVAQIGDREQRIGRVVILPSTFTRAPRFMHSIYQDAMSIVCKYGRPTLFNTFTCNSNWSEIKNNFNSNLNPQDRPELIARVFDLKRKELLNDIIKKNIFGKVIAYFYVIEFQKRRLPHMHCLVTLSDEDKIREPEDVDRIIFAELPDPLSSSRLFSIISATMIHGPCGDKNPESPCMEDGICTKRYTKELSNSTKLDPDLFPVYRRRKDNKTSEITRSNRIFVVDNRDVPYNPYLSANYESHINVEVCSMVGVCKYLFYHVNKGPDAALIRVENELIYDEIRQYIDSRHISSSEAAWRLLKLLVHGKSHTIYRLPLHLPGQRTVYFEEGNEASIAEHSAEKYSWLEAFFNLNNTDTEARKFVYTEIPLYCVYDGTKFKWTKRRRFGNLICRMYTINPRYTELFHLRILLLHVPGPKGFEELHTVNGTIYNTLKKAAENRYLLATDNESVLEHAAQVDMPGSMRKLFVYLLCFCIIKDPLSLWNSFKYYMCEDFKPKGYSEEQAENRALKHIEITLKYLGRSLAGSGMSVNNLRSSFDLTELGKAVEEVGEEEIQYSVSRLNNQQHFVFEVIMAAATSNENQRRYFYLQGSGGTGKTFLYNTILSKLQSRGLPVLAVAFTGIAALLLKNGRTVHSGFFLPLKLFEDSTSSISAQSEEADYLRKIQLKSWDEISMTSHFAINCVDRLLRYVRNDNRSFGGTCILLGGDMKQLLPVANGRTRQIESLFINCDAWRYFEILELTKNMRRGSDLDFANWLLKLGSGELNMLMAHSGIPDIREISSECLTKDVNDIYDDLISSQFDMDSMKRSVPSEV